MPFHPTGSSQKLTVSGGIPQTVEITGLPETGKVVRIMPLTRPTSTVCYVGLGGEDVMLTSANGMPIEIAVMKEQLVSVADETHLALLMSATANYEVMVTPGEIV